MSPLVCPLGARRGSECLIGPDRGCTGDPSEPPLFCLIMRVFQAANAARDYILPPAPAWTTASADLDLLDEHDGELGLVLWQSLRDVQLWATAPPDKRSRLFTPNPLRATTRAAILPALSLPATQAVAKLSALAFFPGFGNAEELGTACRAISDWAVGENKLTTATRFLEAAAYLESANPEIAAAAGYLCFRRADYARATLWYGRAIVLARQARDWVWYIRAHLRLGILYFQLGEHGRARPLYLRAARMAIRSGRRVLAAQAHHDLLTIESDVGSFEQGEEYAARALALYPVRHPRIPHLAHDYAFLLVQNRYFHRALVLLDALSDDLFEPQYRVILYGTAARAAAGVRDRNAFEAAAARVRAVADVTDEYVPAALVHVAEGARSFDEWDRAEAFAGRALDIARRRLDTTAARLAAGLLDEIAVRTPPATNRVPDERSRVTELTRLFLKRLKRRAAPGQVPGATLGSNVPTELGYFAGSGQGTISRPPEPIDPPFSSSA